MLTRGHNRNIRDQKSTFVGQSSKDAETTFAKFKDDDTSQLKPGASQKRPAAEQSESRLQGARYIGKSPLHKRANCSNEENAIRQRDGLRQNQQKPAFHRQMYHGKYAYY